VSKRPVCHARVVTLPVDPFWGRTLPRHLQVFIEAKKTPK
jgi:hypothetical protein